MQKHYVLFCVAIALLMQNVTAQSLDSLFQGGEIQIVVKREKFLVGSKAETIDSLKLENVSGESLVEVISHSLPIYIKQDAGGLSTIHFRGTSPDHTAILFDGININSLTLGHSNLSHIPAFLFDNIEVQFGSSSSLYGTDAIGGSIHLNNKPKWNKGFNLGLQQDVGSFGSYFTGIKTDFSNRKVSYSLKVFRFSKKNNFPFLNTKVSDFEKGGFFEDEMLNTAILNYGLLQELNFKITDNLFSYIKLWYADNWHQVQPNISTNYHGGVFNDIQNKNLRLVSGLKYYKEHHKLTANLGYVYDYQLYNEAIIASHSFLANLDYYHSKFLKGDLNVGFNYQHIKPEVHAYDTNLKEDRIDLFASYKKNITKHLTSSLNIRESIVIDYESQFTPSIGFNYALIHTIKNKLDCKLSGSRSYKIPTFNDRFWRQNGELLGNPGLLPENGMNYELSGKYKHISKTTILELGLTGFFLDVDNWIQWAPDGAGIWRPKNMDRVHSKGLELSLKHSIRFSRLKIRSGFNYTFNKVILVEDYNNPKSDKIGKQLIYSPKHLGIGHLSIEFKKWTLLTEAFYTGSRIYAHQKKEDDILEGYFLFNASIGKLIQVKSHLCSINFKVNNILNKAYQNQFLYAMPGINFAVSIKYNINNLKFKTNENH